MVLYWSALVPLLCRRPDNRSRRARISTSRAVLGRQYRSIAGRVCSCSGGRKNKKTPERDRDARRRRINWLFRGGVILKDGAVVVIGSGVWCAPGNQCRETEGLSLILYCTHRATIRPFDDSTSAGTKHGGSCHVGRLVLMLWFWWLMAR